MRRRTFSQLMLGTMLMPSIGRTENAWSEAAPLPLNVQEIYPCVHQQKLFVAGGIASKLGIPYFTDRTLAFDPNQNAWQEMPALPENRHHVALVSNAGDLFAIGGFNGGIGHFWRMRGDIFRLSDTQWEPYSNLPTEQAEGVATSYKGRIHIVTGQQPRGSENSARSDHKESTLHWIFDRGQWQDLAPIPTPRNSATGGWIGDQLVIAGGRTAQGNLSVTEIYDASTDRWRDAAPMPLPQAGTASVVLDGKLIVFGGEIFTPEAAVFPNVWQYDFAQDSWHALPDLPTPRHGLGAGVIDGHIYVVGGATEPGAGGTTGVNEVLRI